VLWAMRSFRRLTIIHQVTSSTLYQVTVEEMSEADAAAGEG
jgi:hypothetical protein